MSVSTTTADGVDRVDPRIARSREAILAAAVELVAEVGVGAVTVEAIGKRSGVAKTTIYRHWPSLDHLVMDALTAIAAPCVVPDTGTLRGDLLEIALGLARSLGSSPLAKVIPSLVDAAERSPELATLQRGWVKERRSSVRKAIEAAQERGEVGPDLDVELLTALQSGPLFYRRLVSHEPLSPAFVESVVDAVMAVAEATS